MRNAVIVDSNFLFLPIQFKVDIEEEMTKLFGRKLKLILPRPIYEEIRNIAICGKPKEKQQAALALEIGRRLCEIRDIKPIPGETNDDLLVRIAKEMRCPVATNDQALKRRLRSYGIAVVFLRQKSHLSVDGHVES